MTRIFKHSFLLIFWALQNLPVHGQMKYGNEWIDYNRRYLRIPVVKTGFYQITAEDFAREGIPVDSIPSASIQMFRQGKEIAIEVGGNGVGMLGNAGYVLFYGEKNDGSTDSSLYVSPKAMPHSYYSLYSDTTAYFLTWHTESTTAQRIAIPEPLPVFDTIDFHYEESLQLFHSHYLPGKFYPSGTTFENGSVLTGYDYGEGWTGPEIPEKTPYQITLETENVDTIHFNHAEIEMQIANWSPVKHSFELWTGTPNHLKRRLTNIVAEGYKPQTAGGSIQLPDLDNNGKLTLTLIPIDQGGHISVSYVRMRYPQAGAFGKGQIQKIFRFENTEGCFLQKDSLSNAIYYDISDSYHPKKLVIKNSGIMLHGTGQVIGVKEPYSILKPGIVRFSKIDPETDYLIITHPLMHKQAGGVDPIVEYARYRASNAGGNYKTAIINSPELYDQFNSGQPGPQGIRNAIQWLHDWAKLKFVLLAGRSIDPQKARKSPDSWQTDMVPNAGWPGSDIALATPVNQPGFYPSVAIGRINALTSQQLLDYLNKVKAMEAEAPSTAWRKRILHLSGGRSRDELNVFKSYVKSFEKQLNGSSLAAEVQTLSKLTDNTVESLPIADQLNQGVALVTLFGHSGPDVTDVDIGDARDPSRNYRNHPRYPAIIVNGCASGSIFYSTQTLSSNWIFAPESGAVLFLAHTFNGVSTSLKRYTGLFYEVLADTAFTSEPFGIIQQEAIRRNMLRSPTILDGITVQQMLLHGDPAIRIFPAKLPDYSIDAKSILLPDKPGITEDSISIGLIIRNNGRYRNETLRMKFTSSRNDATMYSFTTNRPAIPVADTVYIRIPNDKPVSDDERWLFQMDPEQLLSEENEDNNTLTINPKEIERAPVEDKIPPLLTVTMDGRQLMNGEAVSAKPMIGIRIFDESVPILPNDTSGVAIWLKQQCNGCIEKRVGLANAKGKRLNDGQYELELLLPYSLTAGNYTLTVQCRDTVGNFAAPYQISFKVTDEYRLVNAFVSPNPSGQWFRFTLHMEGPVDHDMNLNITDPKGTTVFEKVFQCHTGLNEWFWVPDSLPSGLYFYKLEPVKNTVVPGPDIRESMRGSLLYIR